MTCEEFLNLLDAYLAGTLPDAEARRLEAHAKECPDCAMLLTLCRDAREAGEEVSVPEGFSAAWRREIRKEERMEERKRKSGAWKHWLAVAAALVFVIGGTLLTREPLRQEAENGAASMKLTSLDTGMYTAGAGVSNFAYEAPQPLARMAAMTTEEEVAADTAAEISADAPQTQKIIRTASFTLKTTEFDQTLADLQALVSQFGGREEYLSQSGDQAAREMRYASLTLRIPTEQLDAFLSGAEGVGRVTALTQEREDVSDSYYDLETRLQTQQAKMERLQALLAQAQTVSELIEIENAIADTQYSLDSYTGRLQHYDSQIAYSTVRVTVREIAVAESQDVSLGQRILAGLRSSLHAGGQFALDALVFLMAALPWLLIVAAVVIVIIVIQKNKKRKAGK